MRRLVISNIEVSFCDKHDQMNLICLRLYFLSKATSRDIVESLYLDPNPSRSDPRARLCFSLACSLNTRIIGVCDNEHNTVFVSLVLLRCQRQQSLVSAPRACNANKTRLPVSLQIWWSNACFFQVHFVAYITGITGSLPNLTPHQLRPDGANQTDWQAEAKGKWPTENAIRSGEVRQISNATH